MAPVPMPEVVATTVPVSMPVTPIARYHAAVVGIQSLGTEGRRAVDRLPRSRVSPGVKGSGAINGKPRTRVGIAPVSKGRSRGKARGRIITRGASRITSGRAGIMRVGRSRRRVMLSRRERAPASSGTALRRLQQSNARSHHQTERADDFHTRSYASIPVPANTTAASRVARTFLMRLHLFQLGAAEQRQHEKVGQDVDDAAGQHHQPEALRRRKI